MSRVRRLLANEWVVLFVSLFSLALGVYNMVEQARMDAAFCARYAKSARAIPEGCQ